MNKTIDLSDIDPNAKGSKKTIENRIRNWARINSPWAIHYNSGSCNGCDIELLTLITPRYDVERFGVKLQGSPRHADILIVTGSVTLQSKDRLIRIYNQMPEPKFVLGLGSCAISGGVFQNCYSVVQGGVSNVIPVDVFVPGCPPRPEAMINGLIILLDIARGKRQKSDYSQPMIIPSPEQDSAQAADKKESEAE